MADKTRAAKTGLGYVVEQKMEQVRASGYANVVTLVDTCVFCHSAQFVRS